MREYSITGRLEFETADHPGRLVLSTGVAVELDTLLAAMQPEEGFALPEGAQVQIVLRPARARDAGTDAPTCPRCSFGSTVHRLVALVSDDGSAYEADACPRCRCSWWHDPPKRVDEIRGVRGSTSAFSAETERLRGTRADPNADDYDPRTDPDAMPFGHPADPSGAEAAPRKDFA